MSNQICLYSFGVNGLEIVLFSGIGHSAAFWMEVSKDLAADHRVWLFDRPGYGRASSPIATYYEDADGQVSALNMIADLARSLESQGAMGPFILVGHSLGALHAQLFAVAHSEKVSKLLLIDPPTKDLVAARGLIKYWPYLVPLALRFPMLGKSMTSKVFSQFSRDTTDEIRRSMGLRFARSARREMKLLGEFTAEVSKANIYLLPASETIVVMTDTSPPLEDLLVPEGCEAQRAEGFTHNLHVEAPTRTATLLRQALGR